MDYIYLFKALSCKNRIRILRILAEAKKGLCICELMTILGMKQYNISKHIRELKMAGFLKEKRSGKFVFYSVGKPGDQSTKYVLKAVGALEKNLFKEDESRLAKMFSLGRKSKKR